MKWKGWLGLMKVKGGLVNEGERMVGLMMYTTKQAVLHPPTLAPLYKLPCDWLDLLLHTVINIFRCFFKSLCLDDRD